MAQLCCGSLNFSSIDGRSASSVVQCVCRLSAPSCPFHEERVSQAARQRSVLCRVSARCGEAQQNYRSPRPRFEYALRAYWGRARPRGGGAPPLSSCFIGFLGPPGAPPLLGGGGIASTLLLTRSRIDTGSRCARTPSDRRGCISPFFSIPDTMDTRVATRRRGLTLAPPGP